MCSCLWLSNIPLYICTTTSLSIHLTVDIRLLPCPSYCKECCSEHWGTCVFFNFGFLMVYAQKWYRWVIWQFYYQFYKESPYCPPQCLYQFTFPPTVQDHSLFSTSSPALVCGFFDYGHSDCCEVISHCSFDLHSSDNE